LQAPEDLMKNQIPAYDVDEHARLERLPMVLEAYSLQFKKDFKTFLELRAKELVAEGQMVVSLTGKRFDDHSSQLFHLWELFAQILRVMVLEVRFFVPSSRVQFYSFFFRKCTYLNSKLYCMMDRV
jgi:jasmonate O-methyltransferase